MEPHESQQINKLAVEEVPMKQNKLARVCEMSNTGSVHEATEIKEMEKNDEFAHVKMLPLLTFNEKPAVELTTLFL